MNKLVIGGLLALGSWVAISGLALALWLGLSVTPASAQGAQVYWECKTAPPVGWCPTSSLAPLPIAAGPYTFARATADALVDSGSGLVHTVTISPTGVVVAGVLTIFDSLTETGTILASIALPVTTFTPFSITLDAGTSTGLYAGFDATLDNVQVTVTYK